MLLLISGIPDEAGQGPGFLRHRCAPWCIVYGVCVFLPMVVYGACVLAVLEGPPLFCLVQRFKTWLNSREAAALFRKRPSAFADARPCWG